MKFKSVKLSATIILFSLTIVTFSVFTYLFHEQKLITTKCEFLKPITSDPMDFISVWDTTKTSSDSSNSNQVKLPLQWDGNYDFTVFWGDGNSDLITLFNDPNILHTYASEGVYTITITGMIIGWCFNDEGDRLKIIDIKQWGSLRLGNSGHYFYGCKNLELTATDNLDLRGTTILHGAFWYCPNLGDSDSMNGWDVSNVTDMSNMFYNAHSFNQPIGSWDVSSVRDMSAMFRGADSFNQPIGSWDVSSVNDMELMFYMANSFNQPISDWDVWIVTNMQGMFLSADSFNQPINNWDVSRVTNMESMFSDTSFNQPLDNWNVSRVTNMAYMFSWTSSFNQPLGSWNVSRVTDMTDMFYKVKLSTSNYDNLLLGWSQLPLQPNVNFNAGNSKYSNASENAKQFIITNFSWIITDGGLATPSSEIPGYILVLIVAVLSVTIAILIKKKYDYYIKS